MPDQIVDPDGQPGGLLQRRYRDVGDGCYAEEVALVEAAPDPANVTGMAGGVNTVLVTVPAGRCWRGSLSVSVSPAAPVGAASAAHTAAITLAGQGAAPAPGPLLEASVTLPATTATAASGAAGANSAHLADVVVVAGQVDATLTVTGTPTARGAAAGRLI